MAGVICLGIGLLLKPHDAGLIWLYFLLAGSTFRKRALQALVGTLVLGALTTLWVTHVAPDWLPELRSNLAFISARGHLNDPGPTSMAGRGILMVISMQSAVSMFRDDPRFYNPITYIVCGALLLMWTRTTLRTRSSQAKAYLALGAVAALTLLPVYHRLGDAKLLMLAVPGCALLWAESAHIGRLAFLVTAAGIAMTGDLEWAVVIGSIHFLHFPNSTFSNDVLMAVQILPAPCILLVLTCFFLWAYVRHTGQGPVGAGTAKP